MRGAAGTMRGAGDVSGAGLQPLVREMLRADRSAEIFSKMAPTIFLNMREI